MDHSLGQGPMKPRRRGFVLGALSGLLVSGAVAGLYLAVSDTAKVAPGPSATASSSPDTRPSPPNDGPSVQRSVRFPRAAHGVRLRLEVDVLTQQSWGDTQPCDGHAFDGRVAYVSGCDWIEDAIDKQLILVSVALWNEGRRAVRYDLEHFLLVSSQGWTLDPVDVREDFDYAPFLLPPTGLIPPDKSRAGWLTFDDRLSHFVGRSLSYVDELETITVRFHGKHAIKTVG